MILKFQRSRKYALVLRRKKRFILDATPEGGNFFTNSRGCQRLFRASPNLFSFSTLRLAVNFQPWREKSKNYQLARRRQRMYDFEKTLVAAIKDGIENADAWKNKIRQNRDALVMPL